MSSGFSSINWFDQITSGINGFLPRVPVGILALLFGFLVIRLVSWLGRFLLGFVSLPSGLKTIIISLMEALLWVFLAITVLQALGLTSLALIFSGSVAALGLALGTGASSLAADILAGIFLAQDRDFRVGDEISAGDKPTTGIVESMDMRRTRLRGPDGRLHVIPNSVIERKEWVLITRKKDRK